MIWKITGVEPVKTIGFIVLSIILIAGLAGIAIRLAAPSPLPEADRETFNRANQLYQAGNYAAAASLYEQLAAKGIANPDLFFNLGNAYTQTGKAEQAAESYAKAAQLAPRDALVVSRLKQAGESLRLPVPLTMNELALGALLVTSTLALLLVGGRHGVFARRTA
jgi:tetratricopeptide (TPR) repeat protein